MLGFKELDLFARTDEILDWNGHRKMLQRAFDQQHVRAMTLKIQDAVQQLVDRLPVDETIDIMPFLKDYGLEMIHLTALGQSVSTLDDRGAFLLYYLASLGQQFSAYVFDPFLYTNVVILPYLGLNAKELQRRKDVPIFRQYCRSLLEKEQEKQRKNDYCDDAAADNLLSIMVAAIDDDTFDSENVIDELTEFIFAGYDTTAITLSNLIHHLATHENIQETLQREIDSVAFDGNYADMVKETPYLSACLRESQRLQPIAPLLLRRLQEDVPFNQGDSSVVIPSGTPVFLPVFLLHRDEKQYPDPESFLPERWLAKDGTLIPPKPGYFCAFGGGPKMCIGFQLADKEVKMAAAAVLREFSIVSRGDVKIVDNFVTGPEKVLLELKRRS
jgi:cytochrome P450